MAFRASNIIPWRAYQQVKGAAAQLKINAQGFVTTMAASGATYGYLRDIYRTLANARGQLDSLRTTPGLAAYAKDQEDDPAYDVAAEFAAMLTAISAAITWMEANVPTNVTAADPSTWATSADPIATTFTAAQTAGLRTRLNTIVAAID